MIILKEDYEILKSILDKGFRLIDAALPQGPLESWDVWEPVYHRIFSDDMSRVIYKLIPSFDPYIPDTSYGEDVLSFWREFVEVMDNATIV